MGIARRHKQCCIKQERPQPFGQHSADFSHRILCRARQVHIAPPHDPAQAQHHSFKLIGGEHQRRQVVAFTQYITHARFPANGNSVGYQCGNIAVNRAERNFQLMGHHITGHRPAVAAENLNQLQKTVGSAHVFLLANAADRNCQQRGSSRTGEKETQQ